MTDYEYPRNLLHATEPMELRRTQSLSARVENSEGRRIKRHRPKTLNIKRNATIPTVSVFHESSAHSTIPNELDYDRENNDDYLLKPEFVDSFRRPTSPSRRRSSANMSLLSRIWKSDEYTKKPAIIKLQTLDVPGGNLTRQMSLSDANLPQEPTTSARKSPVLVLSVKQRKLLRSSFTSMNSGGAFLKLIEQVFRRLEAKCPDIRSIFLTTAFVNSLSRERSSSPVVRTEHDHCKCLVEMFDRIIVASEDETIKELAMFRYYGEKHAQMLDSGFTGHMIENFGEIVVSVICSQDCVKYNHDTMKAWRLLLAFITDEMKVGFDRFSKIRERRGSNTQPQELRCPYQKQYD